MSPHLYARICQCVSRQWSHEVILLTFYQSSKSKQLTLNNGICTLLMTTNCRGLVIFSIIRGTVYQAIWFQSSSVTNKQLDLKSNWNSRNSSRTITLVHQATHAFTYELNKHKPLTEENIQTSLDKYISTVYYQEFF